MIPLRPYQLTLGALGIPQGSEGILLAAQASLVTIIDDLRNSIPPVQVARAGFGSTPTAVVAEHCALEIQAAPTGRGIQLIAAWPSLADTCIQVSATDLLATVFDATPERNAWSGIPTTSVIRSGNIATASLPTDPFAFFEAGGSSTSVFPAESFFVPPGFRVYLYLEAANTLVGLNIGWREYPIV